MGPIVCIFCIYFFLCCINEVMYLDKNNTNSHVSHSISRCYLFHIPCQNSLLHILQLPLHQRLHTLLLFLISRQSLSLRRSKNRGSIFFQKIASNANLFLAAYTTQKSPVFQLRTICQTAVDRRSAFHARGRAPSATSWFITIVRGLDFAARQHLY